MESHRMLDVSPDKQSITITLPIPSWSTEKATYAALAAAGVTAIGAGVWWMYKDRYYSYVPLQYQYRPGTITSWISDLLASHAKRRRSRRPIRVYMDGCFDLMHYGHANALRQAKALGDELVVGLVPDSEILRCKGPPILNEKERLALVESVKWVDEVLTNVPYDLTPEFLNELFTKHKIDYVIHGDDPCIMPDGTDAYAHAKKLGRFRMIKRTEGVSTTDIVGRMLMCSRNNERYDEEKQHLTREFSMSSDVFGTSPSFISDYLSSVREERSMDLDDDGAAAAGAAVLGSSPGMRLGSGGRTSPIKIVDVTGGSSQQQNLLLQEKQESTTSAAATAAISEVDQSQDANKEKSKEHHQQQQEAGGVTDSSEEPANVSRFMPTSRRIVQFSSGNMVPAGGARVVYIDGAFDLFHFGHVEILKLARAQGDFLLVGVHSDEDVTERRGPHTPIMGLHERALSVLACKYADEVIIGAPLVLTEDVITTFGIELVVRGSVHESDDATSENTRYRVAKERGILRELTSPSGVTSATIIQRIVQNRAQFEERQKKKAAAEADYYKNSKQYVNEV